MLQKIKLGLKGHPEFEGLEKLHTDWSQAGEPSEEMGTDTLGDTKEQRRGESLREGGEGASIQGKSSSTGKWEATDSGG